MPGRYLDEVMGGVTAPTALLVPYGPVQEESPGLWGGTLKKCVNSQAVYPLSVTTRAQGPREEIHRLWEREALGAGAALRLRTDAAKRYKRVDRAIAVIWKMLMVAEQRFRRLKAPELIEDVYLGAQYVDGIVSETTAEKVAA